MTKSDSDGNSHVLVFKAPTEDTTKALRIEATTTTQVSWSQNSKFWTMCAVHDVGTTLTSITNIDGFELEHRCFTGST